MAVAATLDHTDVRTIPFTGAGASAAQLMGLTGRRRAKQSGAPGQGPDELLEYRS